MYMSMYVDNFVFNTTFSNVLAIFFKRLNEPPLASNTSIKSRVERLTIHLLKLLMYMSGDIQYMTMRCQ